MLAPLEGQLNGNAENTTPITYPTTKKQTMNSPWTILVE
jgi:hypothetical protein